MRRLCAGRARRATCWCSSPAPRRSAARARRCADLRRARTAGPAAAARRPAARRSRTAPCGRGPRRKVILSTNVAETSVTIDGVVAVIDSGLARVASHSPWSGLPTLERREGQPRLGDAARRPRRAHAPGPLPAPLHAGTTSTRAPSTTRPEMLRGWTSRRRCSRCAASGVRDLAASRGSRRRPRPALEAARALLARLGAIDARGRAHADRAADARASRCTRGSARLVVEASARGVGARAALARRAARRARHPRSRRALEGAARCRATGPSDLLELARRCSRRRRARASTPDRLPAHGRWTPARPRRWTGSGGSSRAGAVAPRGARARRGAPAGGAARRRAPARDARGLPGPRRARRRERRGSDEVVLVGRRQRAGSIRASVVREAPLLVAIDAEERRGDRRPRAPRGAEVRVRIASAVAQELLLDLFPDALRYDEAVSWNAAGRAGRARSSGSPTATSCSRRPAPPAPTRPEVAARVLAEAALARGARALRATEGALDRLRARSRFARGARAGGRASPPVEAALAPRSGDACAGRAQLRRAARGRPPGALLARARRPGPRARSSGSRPSGSRSPAGAPRRIEYEAGEAALDRDPGCRTSSGWPQGPAVGGRARAAGAPPARAEPARGAGDHRPRRLLGAALPRDPPRALAPLPAPRLARDPRAATPPPAGRR